MMKIFNERNELILKAIGNFIFKMIMVVIFLVVMVLSTAVLGFAYMRYGKDTNNTNVDNSILNILQNNTPKERVNVLVVGTNQNLTDFIMVAGYNPASGDISMMSIPRDTKYAKSNTAFSKINAIYQGKHIDKLQAEIEDILDIEIDYYVIFDKKALWEVVDALGGVTVDVGSKPLKYSDPEQNLYINIPAGVQKLDGKKAEQYVRFRKGYANGDIGRIGAQQNFIKAFITECIKPTNIPKLPEVAKIGFENIKTDVTLDTILYYLEDVAKIDLAKIRMETLPGEGRTIDGVSFYIMFEKEIEKLSNEMFNWDDETEIKINE